MTVTFTEHDRKLLMKRFRQAAKKKDSETVVTVLHVTEVYAEQQQA